MSGEREYPAVPCTTWQAHHAEGPMWDHSRAELLWVDVYRGLVHRARWDADARDLRLEHTYRAGQAVGAVVPCADAGQGWIAATEFGFSRLRADGSFQVLAEPERGRRPATRMNDGKCDPRGRFWAGSMAHDRARGAGTLHLLAGDISRPALGQVTISNGLAWPGADELLYIDTPTQRVDRLLVAADGGIASRETAFAIAPGLGAPDGMTVDQEGCLWIAMWGAGTVLRFTPAGEVVARISLPARQVSSCCFGGPDLRTLFVTTSQENYTPGQSSEEPDAGRLFAAEVDVPGHPADLYLSGAKG
jgi:sugar lactone lactonase YvrE